MALVASSVVVRGSVMAVPGVAMTAGVSPHGASASIDTIRHALHRCGSPCLAGGRVTDRLQRIRRVRVAARGTAAAGVRDKVRSQMVWHPLGRPPTAQR